jgi:hypothetical protein
VVVPTSVPRITTFVPKGHDSEADASVSFVVAVVPVGLMLAAADAVEIDAIELAVSSAAATQAATAKRRIPLMNSPSNDSDPCWAS